MIQSLKNYYRLLTIAGSDSGGGAGIQADLKTFSALGCYGMSVITALTAQNTVSVTGIYPVSTKFVAEQIDAVVEDIGVDAVKIGMLNTSDIIHIVAERLSAHKIKNVVLDTVMVAKSGDKLLSVDAIDSLRKKLIPLSTIITPNLPETSILLGHKINTKEEMEKACYELIELGTKSVLVKGGHRSGHNLSSDDCLCIKDNSGEKKIYWFETERINTNNTHGTGCTLSSSIAVFLAKGYGIKESVQHAKKYITSAIKAGSYYKLGKGHGPVYHFYKLWKE
jgi:hydroxymethylpyrimidine/phosphomethylpyrimidine kinase